MVVKNVIKGHMAHDEIERLTIIDPDTDDIAIYAGKLQVLYISDKMKENIDLLRESGYFDS